ncbi:MAG: hypothetical protein U5L72_19380 [Bacteroidales bacterium]|nr:hypothetical protein [Bacteroidales bacterium]
MGNEYKVYVDDLLIFTFANEGTGYKVWPFNKRFHLLLNVAVGGNWGGVMGIDDTIFPRTMEVDLCKGLPVLEQSTPSPLIFYELDGATACGSKDSDDVGAGGQTADI